MPMTPPDCARWFAPGTVVATKDRRDVTFEVRELGEVGLPTGRLVACDPIVHLCDDDERPEPFAAEVPPGRYRVQIARASFTYPYDHTVNAAARLLVRDAPVARWEPARVACGTAPEDGSPGYGVDAGLGCFLDAAAHHAFPGTDDEEGVIWEVLDGPGSPDAFLAEGEDGHTIAVFSSGWGDGLYATWVGYDADGGAACFVTDFQPFRFAGLR
ncbi:DUF4241 domain-containing protein [Streptomyces termitum]|uniref:DUF4241 domain-containing protein n=1 Tax=Streptomyces termitum TaxID=67368 RepID=UPI0033A0DB23